MLKLIDEDYMKNPSFKTCRDRYMLYIMIFCGLRNGEVRSLKLDSIKLDGSFKVNGKYRIITKGAPDILLSKCNHYYINGTSNLLTYNIRDKIEKLNMDNLHLIL